MALSSVNKFLLYGFVTPDSPRAHEAINRCVQRRVSPARKRCDC